MVEKKNNVFFQSVEIHEMSCYL